MKLLILFSILLHFTKGKNIGTYLPCNNGYCGSQTYPPHTPHHVNTRVIGGKHSVPHSWPWMVAIYYNNYLRCGGALIRSCDGAMVVLTSGRCVENRSPLVVRTGQHSLSAHEPIQSDYTVQETILHANFSPLHALNDIAILKVSTPIVENDGTKPICVTSLPSSHYYGESCVLTGWGLVNSSHVVHSDILNEVYKPVKNDSECHDLLGDAFVGSQMVCAGVDGRGICNGDIGGPLACKNTQSGLYDLIGISSWGFTCGDSIFPGAYVDVHEYLDWISTHA